MSVNLQISNLSRRAINTRWLKQQLQKLLKLQKIRTGNWSITIVNDQEMSNLHQRTMNDPTTTDVLTFDLRDPSPRRRVAASPRRSFPLDLDTILCRDVAARTAKELRHSLNHELLLYALHSLLHVQGYDDLTPADFARMHRREDALLIASGIGPLYNRTRSVSEGPVRLSNRTRRPSTKPTSKKSL